MTPHLADDPARAQAEYLAQFRSDLEAVVSREAVLACVSAGVYERPPMRGMYYSGFVDPSGGSVDAMTLCVGHKDYGRQSVIVDALREVRPPFSPETVVADFSRLLKTYGIKNVAGDKYAGVWPLEQFGKFGIRYEASATPKSVNVRRPAAAGFEGSDWCRNT